MNQIKRKVLSGFFIAIVLAGLLLTLYPIGVNAESDLKDKIAYVDVMEIFNVHPQKAVAENKLNELAQNMQSELENKAKDLPKNEQQNMLQEYQDKLNQQEQDVIQKILEDIEGVIALVAQQKEIRIVLDKKNVIYGGYDMTQDVIDYINTNLLNQENTDKEIDQ